MYSESFYENIACSVIFDVESWIAFRRWMSNITWDFIVDFYRFISLKTIFLLRLLLFLFIIVIF